MTRDLLLQKLEQAERDYTRMAIEAMHGGRAYYKQYCDLRDLLQECRRHLIGETTGYDSGMSEAA